MGADDQRGTRRRSCHDYGLLTAAGKTVAATQLGRYSLHCCGQRCHKLWEWGLCGDRVLFIKGWFGGAPKLRGFESDTVSHFDKLITEQDHAASGRWVHQRPGGQA